jgi:hypothetical protein
MRRTVPQACCFLALLGLVSGCTKLNDERTVQVAPGDEHKLFIDPAKKEQRITVSVSSPGTPVNVSLLLENDPKKALDSKEKVEEATLNATIPADNKAVVLLTSAGARTANVKVKITNK